MRSSRKTTPGRGAVAVSAAAVLMLGASLLISSVPALAQGYPSYPAVPNESAPSVVTLSGVAVGDCPCMVVATSPDGSTRAIIVLESGGSWSLDVPVMSGITTVTVDGVVVQEIVQAIITANAPTITCPPGTSGTPVAGGTCTRPGTTTETIAVNVSCPEPINPATGECDNPVASCPAGYSGTPVIGGTCSRTVTSNTQEAVVVTANPRTVSCPAGTVLLASTEVCVRNVAANAPTEPAGAGSTATNTPVVVVAAAVQVATPVAAGVVVPAADYGFTNGIPVAPTLALTGPSRTSDLGFLAAGLILFGALASAGRRLKLSGDKN